MITIGTNILDKLSPEHQEQIKESAQASLSPDSVINLGKYIEETANEVELPKYFFGNLPLEKMIQEIALWDSFGKLLNEIFNYTQQDIPNVLELQFWITAVEKSKPINIFFSVKKSEDITTKLLSLREIITTSKIFETSVEEGKIIIIGYDKTSDSWRINYL